MNDVDACCSLTCSVLSFQLGTVEKGLRVWAGLGNGDGGVGGPRCFCPSLGFSFIIII